jgi:uncharacterized sulfatase
MGCYGDKYASTPHVDKLAVRGTIYTRVWSCAPVCAPARTTIISGLYPPSTGAEHMRSMVPFPRDKKMFPQYLREAGYYCTNNAKEDYNLAKSGQVWDESSTTAHWRNRRPGQPFFAVFNSLKSHESQIRSRPHKPVHDPALVRIPAYHPDTPEVRRDWAQYYDVVSEADADAGERLQELDDAGLADDTIVFYWADHGSGMPRSKRWPCDSGLHVPLVVFIPAKYRHLAAPDYKPGGKSDRLISFLDFAPTVLALAGIKPPDWMQGQAFLGRDVQPPPAFLHGFRGRMDERYDMVRSVTDGRYVYIRNYMPHRIYGQHVDYMFQTPTTRVWKKLHDEGKLTAVQDAFWNTKPPEELYDLQNDSDEVNDLVGSPASASVLDKFRRTHRDWTLRIIDVGFLPEGEIHSRSAGSTPYDMGHDPKKYPLQRIFEVAELAASRDGRAIPKLKEALKDEDSAVRYWAALGFLIRGQTAVAPARDELWSALGDKSPYVRCVAAESIGRYGRDVDRPLSLAELINLAHQESYGVFTAMAALNALGELGPKAAPARDAIRALSAKGRVPDPRYSPFVPQLIKSLQASFND